MCYLLLKLNVFSIMQALILLVVFVDRQTIIMSLGLNPCTIDESFTGLSTATKKNKLLMKYPHSLRKLHKTRHHRKPEF